MLNSSVTFRPGGPQREVAIIGGVEFGEVVEIAGHNGRARAWWRTALPDDDVKAPVGAPSVERAKRDLSAHVWSWLDRAGLSLNRSQDQPTRAAG